MEATKQNSLLKNKQYVYLIASQLVSSFGDWLDILALMALVGLKWEVSPLQMAGVMLSMALPMILFGPLAGVFADRFDRKKMMILSDIVRCLVVIGFVFVTSLWQVYVLLFIKGAFSSLFVPAKNGKLKEIVDDEQMQQAMGISGMIDNGSKIVGPMISGVLVSTAGIYWAFYIDAATFIVSALLLIGIKRSTYEKVEAKPAEQKVAFLSQLKEGFQFLKGFPSLLFGLIVLSLSLFVLQIADSQLVILFRDIDGNTIDLLGYCMAASGAGMFIVSAILTRKKKSLPINFAIAVGATILGLCFAVLPLLIHLPASMIMIIFPILFFIAGTSAGIIIISFNVGAQKATPVQLSGRVFGTINSMTTFAALIGMAMGGLLAEAFGVVSAILLSGSLLTVVGIATFIITRFLERRDRVAKGHGRLQGETTS
ncbi:MFS transporter [Cytobacillus sp. IB215316]|uniref:MFS transporter n=1 Tax=Cytobacillus sp. IB215316 TaxID=3097354 RepID=UPI002A15824C|nr:MFS transporter [Cytobacillus sp. IB215316]MDX8361154.1 MFS transporter [Cytobacillus sp. IB215316]